MITFDSKNGNGAQDTWSSWRINGKGKMTIHYNPDGTPQRITLSRKMMEEFSKNEDDWVKDKYGESYYEVYNPSVQFILEMMMRIGTSKYR